jgi:hypothetical protein
MSSKIEETPYIGDPNDNSIYTMVWIGHILTFIKKSDLHYVNGVLKIKLKKKKIGKRKNKDNGSNNKTHNNKNKIK